MTRSAVVQGENHLNNRDVRTLLSDEFQSDILYIEGRSNENIVSFWPIDYFLFLTGALTLYAGYSLQSNFLRLVGREFNIKREAHRRDIDTYSNIDLELPEIYERISANGRTSSLVVAVLVALLSAILLIQNSLFEIIIGAIGCTSVPFIHFSVIITQVLPKSVRDQSMGDSIIQHAEDNEHHDVIVLVGDQHVEGIASHLENEGWYVTRRESNDSTMRIQRRIRSLLFN